MPASNEANLVPDDAAPVAPVPTPQQAAWQRMGRTMFVHFGVNTYTDREWGDGKEPESIFDPEKLDCRQWARAARAGGFGLMMLTAKHHDGFCLFPSKYTEHSVRNSPWKNGKGDVVREFVDACHHEHLKVGLYLSPWDRHEPTYGDSPAYNAHFEDQLRELLTEYGDITQVWFDGANGEGPNGKKQVYDWDAFYRVIRELQPNALISITGPDVRWVGNESGVAREDESSVQTRDGKEVWWPAECDVSIRPGWFYHADQDSKVRSVDNLVDLYFQSVARNSVFLLNVPPNRDGLFSAPDVASLEGFGKRIHDLFADNLAAHARFHTSGGDDRDLRRLVDADPDSYWAAPAGATTAEITAEFDQPTMFDTVRLREPILLGERIRGFRIEAETPTGWTTIAQGKVIGNDRSFRVPGVITQKVRVLVTEARGQVLLSEVGLYAGA